MQEQARGQTEKGGIPLIGTSGMRKTWRTPAQGSNLRICYCEKEGGRLAEGDIDLG